MTEGSKRAPSRLRTRRRPALIVGGLLLLALIVLILLALPLLGVKGDAETAKAELTAAKKALVAGDIREAKEHVASARTNINSASDTTEGLSGDIWSVLPIAGTAVDDVRHLVSAMHDATAIAKIGVEVYPTVAGKQATLFRNERIDLDALATVTDSVRDAGTHLSSASAALDEIDGSTPFIGGAITARRDEAADEIDPMAEAYDSLEPMLDELPAIVGADGESRYLISMTNPTELRYSGGATLAFAPMTITDGKIDVGDSVDFGDYPALAGELRWRKVPGNTFHYPGPQLIRNATFAPSWSVSGEEVLRMWQEATGDRYEGLLAVDVVTLARLFGVTGGVEVSGYGTLTEENLVETLVGSYDDYYPDPSAQDEMNSALIPAFKDQLFGGGEYVDKVRVLEEAADGRHFALYFRNQPVQDGFAGLGMTGDLAEPRGDYLGVFTQNTNGSKVDYWQRRDINTDVTLSGDGTAQVDLGVTVHNDSPPYAVPEPDPKTGYFTRWAGMALGVFLPDGADVGKVTLRGEPYDGYVGNFFNHDFVYQKMLLEPGATARLEASYDVPDAATVDGDELTYHLTMDPQGMVIPQTATVTVHLPEDYTATDVPEGWTAEGSSLTFTTDAFDSTQEWEITAEPTE